MFYTLAQPNGLNRRLAEIYKKQNGFELSGGDGPNCNRGFQCTKKHGIIIIISLV